MKRTLPQIIIWMLLSSICLQGYGEQSKVLKLSDLSSVDEFEDFSTIYVDESNRLEIEDLRSLDFHSSDILNSYPYPSYLDHTFWMRIQILNDLNNDTTLLVSPGRFKHCEVFIDQGNNSLGKFGFGLTRKLWADDISPDYYPIRFKKDSSTLIFISARSHVQSFERNIDFSIMNRNQLETKLQEELKKQLSGYRIQHVFFGILFFLIIFSILALIQKQGIEYFYFLLTLVFAIFYFLELVQRDRIYDIYFGIYNHGKDFFHLISYLGGFSTMLFIATSLGIKDKYPRIHLAVRSMVGFFFFAFIIHLIMIIVNVKPSSQIQFNLFLRKISTLPIVLCFVWLILKDRSQIVMIILFGMTCLVIFDVAFNLMEATSYQGNSHRILQGGFVAQALSFMIALIIKQRKVSIEKDQAQNDLIEQLNINSDLKEKYNKDLQAEVNQKTEQLVQEKEKTLKSQYENELLKLESELLASQMNPHFIFNSLNSIKYYAQTKTPEETARYITTFAKLMRMMLHNSNQRIITLSEEIDFLNKYLEVERRRSDNLFEYKIEVDKNIDTQKLYMPPMVLQPYVENSIWHGIKHIDKDGKLEISFKSSQDCFICQIRDNGIGLKASQKLNSNRTRFKSRSFGTSITKDRLDKISQLYELELSVRLFETFDELDNSLGTTVELTFPILKSNDLNTLPDN